MGVNGRGVFDAEFAETAGGAEADEVESPGQAGICDRKFKVESKTSEKNLRTRWKTVADAEN
jgi:hypothetical protein